MKWTRIKAGEYQAGAWTVRRFVYPPNAKGRKWTQWEVWHHGKSLFGCRESLAAGQMFAEVLSHVHGVGRARKLQDDSGETQ